VAWTVVANTARNSTAAAAAAAKAGHPPAGTAAQVKAAIYDHALSVGFGRGFEVSAGIMLIALVITVAAVRVRRADLAGAQAAQPRLPRPAGEDVSTEMLEAGQSGRAGPAADDLRGVTDVSASPDAPTPDRRPEPGRPR
jgi:hypothetical protein